MERSFTATVRSGGNDVLIITLPKAIAEYEQLKIGDELKMTLKKINNGHGED